MTLCSECFIQFDGAANATVCPDCIAEMATPREPVTDIVAAIDNVIRIESAAMAVEAFTDAATHPAAKLTVRVEVPAEVTVEPVANTPAPELLATPPAEDTLPPAVAAAVADLTAPKHCSDCGEPGRGIGDPASDLPFMIGKLCADCGYAGTFTAPIILSAGPLDAPCSGTFLREDGSAVSVGSSGQPPATPYFTRADIEALRAAWARNPKPATVWGSCVNCGRAADMGRPGRRCGTCEPSPPSNRYLADVLAELNQPTGASA